MYECIVLQKVILYLSYLNFVFQKGVIIFC